MSASTYEGYFGLREKPFSLASDPRFLYRSAAHAGVFDQLLGGIERREGVLVLTGDIGTGKTTLCRAVLQSLPRKTFSAFVPDPFASREDLLKMLLIDFGVMSVQDLTNGHLQGATRTELSYLLYDFLDSLVPLEAFVVVIIDEAQNLSPALIEEVRILSDLHRRASPLQVLFVGQLELRDKLKLPEMRQVDQRVALHCSLEPITRDALGGYVAHRLRVAGAAPDRVLFPPDALDAVFEASAGVPRLINRICDRTMYQGFQAKTSTFNRAMVAAAIREAGAAELPGALAVRPSPAPVVVAVREAPRPGIDDWLKAVDGTSAATVPGANAGTEPVVTELGPVPAPAASHEPWVLGPPPSAHHRRQWLARFPMPTLPAMLPRRRLGTAAAAVLGVAVSGLSMGVPGYRTALAVLPVPAAPPSIVAPVVAPAAPSAPPIAAGGLEVGAIAAPAVSRVAAPVAAPVPVPAEILATSVKGPTADTDGQGYVLEVALFESTSRGSRLVDELAAAGFRAFDQPLVLGSRGSFRQVLVGPFATRDDADRDLARLRQRGGYSDARVAARMPLRNGTTE
jgi:type II secretory pathway predicted ATPase ExeA/cell division septation protein DedD